MNTDVGLWQLDTPIYLFDSRGKYITKTLEEVRFHLMLKIIQIDPTKRISSYYRFPLGLGLSTALAPDLDV